jgi:hypothetical protein
MYELNAFVRLAMAGGELCTAFGMSGGIHFCDVVSEFHFLVPVVA